MNKIRCLIAFFVVFLVLSSCGSGKEMDELDSSEKDVTISTKIITRSVRTDFLSGDALNIFVKSDPSTSGKDFGTRVKATYSDSWILSPSVKVPSASNIYVYAIYPYKSDNVNANAIPVKVSDQVDYLYSGTAATVSYSSPRANLEMKHAMDIIAFNIVSDGYVGPGILSSISLNGDGFTTEGTLDIGTGKITAISAGEYNLTCNNNITNSGWSETTPQLFALPISSTGKNVMITTKIDNKDYSVYLPKVSIEGGMKYIFKLALTANGISVFSDNIEVISLNKAGSAFTLGKYGAIKIAYSGKKAVIPELSGTNVLGAVYWDNDGNQDTYSPSISFTYLEAGTHNVKIDSWGADKISFTDLTDVDEIDLSSF